MLDLLLGGRLLSLQVVHRRPSESVSELGHLVPQLGELVVRVLLLVEPRELLFHDRELLLLLGDECVHLLDLLLDVHELVGDLLEQRRFGEEIVLVAGLSAVKKLARRVLGHDDDRVVDVDVEVVGDAVELIARATHVFAVPALDLDGRGALGDVALDHDDGPEDVGI